MRRLRRRRRRLRALALAPLAALIAVPTTIPASGAGAPAERATIESSDARVVIGERVTLRGAFADAAEAPVEIRHRPAGESRWELAGRTRTGPGGAWRARVAPRASGHWRAELATQPEAETAASAPAETGAGESAPGPGESKARRILVRSRVTARPLSRHILAGREVEIAGSVAPGGQRPIALRIGGERVATRTDARGRYSFAWRPPRPGVYEARVDAGPNRLAAGSEARLGKLTAYRPASASWYGPGLYGNRTACGQTLTPATIGVAHKTMPCGTKLRLRHRGRSVTARVIDRGPYAAGREFDLTAATRQALGFGDTGTVLSSR